MNDLIFDTDSDESVLSHCVNCNQPIAAESRFCSYCGFAQANNSDEPANEKFSTIKQIALFFLIEAIICCVASFIVFFKTLAWSITFDIILAIVAVVFFSVNWSRYRSLLVWHNFSLVKLLGYCIVAVISSFIVSFFVGWLNQSLFSKDFSYYAFYAPHKHGKELTILFVAVMPALFEELGYRGFLLGKFLQIVDKKQAIFISAFLFAIMHTSFISLFWLIPFALWQSYIRIKENTLWYGVCIHFCFNFTVCMTEILRQNHHH